MRILVFGDSIAFGGYDTKGGWVDRIKHVFLEEHVNGADRINILNFGIGGDTSEFLLQRIESTVQSARISDKDIRFIFSIGVNDSRLKLEGNEKTPQTSIDDYRRNIREILTLFRKYSDKILCVGLTTIDPSVDDVYPKTYEYSRDRITEYGQALEQICEHENIAFIEVVSKIAGKPEMFFRDHLHLSDEGHQKIAEIVLPAARKLTQ